MADLSKINIEDSGLSTRIKKNLKFTQFNTLQDLAMAGYSLTQLPNIGQKHLSEIYLEIGNVLKTDEDKDLGVKINQTSLRDYFAAKAMQSIVEKEWMESSLGEIAKYAYELANEMMAEKENQDV
jgi:hypothetical protein